MRSKRLKAVEFLSYLASSARNLVHEPKAYGPFRLVEAMVRFVDVYSEITGERDERLKRIKEFIEERKILVVHDERKFYEFLDSLVDMVLEEAKRELEG